MSGVRGEDVAVERCCGRAPAATSFERIRATNVPSMDPEPLAVNGS